MYVSLMGVGIQCCKKNEMKSSIETRQTIRVDPFGSKSQSRCQLAWVVLWITAISCHQIRVLRQTPIKTLWNSQRILNCDLKFYSESGLRWMMSLLWKIVPILPRFLNRQCSKLRRSLEGHLNAWYWSTGMWFLTLFWWKYNYFIITFSL